MTPTFSVVRTATTAVEADLIISALRAGGFHPTELSTSSHFSIAGAAISYAVEVPSEELAAAQEFLSSFESEAQSPATAAADKP
jgi:hypothetical protein